MKLFICIFMISTMVSCSMIDRKPLEYTTKQKALTASMITLQGLDVLTTHNLTTNPEFEEGNTVLSGLFGSEVTWEEAIPFKLLVLGPAYYAFIHKAKTQKSRDRALWIFNGLSIAPVINNVKTGSSMAFKINW